jgi:dimethylglycine dehydrogenase
VARRELAGDDNTGLTMFIVYCEVDAIDSDCRGNEPVYEAGTDTIMGITTSGAWGHTIGRSLCFAYVDPAFREPGSTFEIGLLGERHMATVLDSPAHDPTNKRLRA